MITLSKRYKAMEDQAKLILLARELDLPEEVVHYHIFIEGIDRNEIRKKYVWREEVSSKFAKYLYV